MTLSDPTPPSAPIAGGALSQPTWHPGTAELDLSSTDAVGISQIQVKRADGAVLASASLSCDYTYPVPCGQAAAVPLQIDTTRLPDGIDQLTLTATDAAQNTSTSTVNVMVANHIPPAPRLTGAPTGPTVQPSAMITAQLETVGVPISSLAWMLCASTCGAPIVLPVPVGGSTVTFGVTAPTDGAYTIAAYTLDAAGHRSPTATEAFTVDRTAPGSGGSSSGRPGSGEAGGGAPQTLPAGNTASLTLPDAVGRSGVRLRLALRRRAHHRIELDVRADQHRSGHLRLGFAFGGRRATILRLTLHRGIGSVTVSIPSRTTQLTLTVAGLGTHTTDHIRLTG